MKESISYTFLLNIIITFVFVCFTIIMGIFSYYRAFKANNIIINEIEKYEGYNCLSKASIKEKLNSIAYNLPFNAECDSKDGYLCTTDEDKNYKIISYNIDFSTGNFANIDGEEFKMDSVYNCSYQEGTERVGINFCKNTRQYQYGVYTYMYVDLPVVSNLLKLKLFSKTSIMHDYRKLAIQKKSEDIIPRAYDLRLIPSDIIKNSVIYYNFWNNWSANELMGPEILSAYASASVGKNLLNNNPEYNARLLYQYDVSEDSNNSIDGKIDANDSTFAQSGYNYSCGFKRNYSLY